MRVNISPTSVIMSPIRVNIIINISNYITGGGNYITEISDYITKISDYITEISDYITGRGNYITEISDYITGRGNYITEISDYITGRGNYITEISDIFTPLSKNKLVKINHWRVSDINTRGRLVDAFQMFFYIILLKSNHFKNESISTYDAVRLDI